LVPKLSNLN